MGNTILGSCYITTEKSSQSQCPTPLHALTAETTIRLSNKCAPPSPLINWTWACLPTKWSKVTKHRYVVVSGEWKKLEEVENKCFCGLFCK